MATFTPEPLGRRDASGQIARQLRTAISSGVWSPGERLPSEVELAEAFDVARATAREGLKLLSAAGLVASVRGSNGGTFVAVPDSEEVAEQLADAISLWYRAGNVSVRDVDEARWVLEMHCVELAALRRDDDDLAAIKAAVDAAKDADLPMPEWLDLDLIFHTAITRAARNPILELAMTAVHLARPATNSVFVDQLDRDRVSDQHEAIYLQIAAGNPDGARAAFQGHVEYLDETRRQALQETSPDTVLVSTLPPMHPGHR